MKTWCMITNGRASTNREAWLKQIAKAVAGGAQWIQIREKDLAARDLLELAKQAIQIAGDAKVLINSRLDVALAAGAAGVHLPADSPGPARFRPLTPPGFLIGVSCHTIPELKRADEQNADYAIFGPVFSPLSKTSDLTPRGLAGLKTAAKVVNIPVLAIGGITKTNAGACFEAGASGIAAITLFAEN